MRDIGPVSAPGRHASQLHGEVVPLVEAEFDEVEPATGQIEVSREEEPMAEKPGERSGRRVGWWLAMIGIGGVVGMIGVGYLKFIDGPSVGTANADSLQAARAAVAPAKATPNLLSGLVIELQYPSVFDTLGQVKTDPKAIEQYNIGSKGDYARSIGVSVRPLPGGLDDDSSYRYRQISKDKYKETDDVIGTEPIVMMTKLDHLEKTLFWVHQGREVTVSITINNPSDDLEAYMNQVKSTIRWRK